MSSRILALLNGGGEPAPDVQIEQLSEAVDDLQPTFPKELVAYSLMRTGFNCTDPRVSRLVALAAQKFITEISDDALQFCKIRQQNPALRDKQRGKEKRLVLTMDDLSAALRDYGVSLRKPDYFADRADGLLPREEGKAGAKGESDAEGKPAAVRRPRKKKGADAGAAGSGAGAAGPDSPKAEKPKRRKVDGKEAKKEAADA